MPPWWLIQKEFEEPQTACWHRLPHITPRGKPQSGWPELPSGLKVSSWLTGLSTGFQAGCKILQSEMALARRTNLISVARADAVVDRDPMVYTDNSATPLPGDVVAQGSLRIAASEKKGGRGMVAGHIPLGSRLHIRKEDSSRECRLLV